jgi:MFS family permease
MSFYAVCVVGGPTLGPTIGAAALVNPHLGWRWTEYIEAIVTFAVVLLTAIFLPEIYPPVLLARKARKMRKSTGNTAYYHPSEQNKLDVNTVVTKHLTRPLRMLTTEPIVTAIAIYASFVFGLLYLTLEVFPIVYLEDRGWPVVSATLPFIGLFVGILCALGINLGNIKRYARISDAAGGKPVPEARLQPMILGSIIFPIGLFWFGWTANPKYHWAIPTVATGFIGAGFNIIFQQCINYLVDSYGLYAASATSANTFLRSIMAAGLPLAANPMFHSLGVGPAMSILGAIAVLAIAVPFLFLKYAIVLRSKSAFAMAKGGK